VGSLYGFFALDRLLQYVFELRRRNVQRGRVHASPSIQRMMESSSSQETNELEIAVLHNIVGRTLSTRNHVALVKVDEIKCDSTAAFPSSDSRQMNGEMLLQVPSDLEYMKEDDASLSVRVFEQRVANTKDLEIASIAYILIVGGCVNNFLDGMSMGAAFGDSLLRGVSIGFSSFSQQFPQEVGTLAILANS
ncbi:hypothetical protein PENTCL1PPCAC_16030, partial [Pristionchus entomophagus]